MPALVGNDVHAVLPGEQLLQISRDELRFRTHQYPSGTEIRGYEHGILSVNPRITDLNRIYPGERLTIPPIQNPGSPIQNPGSEAPSAGSSRFPFVQKVSEAQIQEAFAYQKSLPSTAPRRLLGQILQDKGYVSEQDVNAAFSAQNEMKTHLQRIREAAMKQGS